MPYTMITSKKARDITKENINRINTITARKIERMNELKSKREMGAIDIQNPINK